MKEWLLLLRLESIDGILLTMTEDYVRMFVLGGNCLLQAVDASGGTEADINLDAGNDIILDAGSGNITAKDDGGNYTPSSDYHVATKKYVDDNAGGASALNDLSDVTYSSGDLTISSLDKIVAMCGQLERDLKFSPRAAATTSNTFDITFPNLAANKVLSVNSAGDGLEFAQDITDITTIAGIASDVTTVSGIAANVTTVAGAVTNINTVASNITNINTVATNIADIITVANDLNEAVSEIETVASDYKKRHQKLMQLLEVLLMLILLVIILAMLIQLLVSLLMLPQLLGFLLM